MTNPTELFEEGQDTALKALALSMRAMVTSGMKYGDAEKLFRMGYARTAVNLCRGNKCAAARMLGVHRNTLSRLLEEQ